MKKGKLLALPTILWLVVFFLVPILLVVGFSFFERGTYGDVVYNFNFENYVRAFDPLYMGILIQTLVIAVATTFFTLLIAYPYAYAITLVSPKWQKMLLLLVTIPFWINFLVRSYAWVVLLRTQGLVNTILLNLGFINEPLTLLYNTPVVILGMVYTLIPFMVLPIYVSMEQLDRRKLEAAYDLGATPFRTFWHVTLPMTMSGVVTGSILVFVSSLGMFIVSDILGGSKISLIGNVIQNQFLGARDWPFGSALSVVLILFTVIFIFIYYRVTMKNAVEGGGEKG